MATCNCTGICMLGGGCSAYPNGKQTLGFISLDTTPNLKDIQDLKAITHAQEQSINHIQVGIEKCFEKIEKIDCERQLTHKSLEMLIEENINNIHNRNSKKPYKCPVCEGKCKVRVEPKYSLSGDGMKVADERHFGPVEYSCHACEGRGIVWG